MKAIGEESPEILAGLLATLIPQAAGPIRMFQATLKGQFLRQLLVELERLRKAGAIREDYLKSDPAKACFADLLDAIDKTSPDPKRLDAMRRAFLKTMEQGTTGHDAPYSQQMLRVIYGLSAGEIVALAAIYQMGGSAGVAAISWLTEVANKSGLLRLELVEEVEESLDRKRLIHPRAAGKSGRESQNVLIWGQRNRLTTLGQEVCERIQAV